MTDREQLTDDDIDTLLIYGLFQCRADVETIRTAAAQRDAPDARPRRWAVNPKAVTLIVIAAMTGFFWWVVLS